MIYVVERNGAPVQLRSSAGVAAYLTRDKAVSAARALGGDVVSYSFHGAADEGVAREIADLRRQRDQAREVLKDHMDGNMLLRMKHGARQDETMGQWIARLYRGYREYARMMELLRGFYGVVTGGEP